MTLKEHLAFLKRISQKVANWPAWRRNGIVPEEENFSKEFMEEKLYPCPFCGSENIDYEIDHSRPYEEGQVFCNNCEAEGPVLTSYTRLSDDEIFKKIVKSWNRRIK